MYKLSMETCVFSAHTDGHSECCMFAATLRYTSVGERYTDHTLNALTNRVSSSWWTFHACVIHHLCVSYSRLPLSYSFTYALGLCVASSQMCRYFIINIFIQLYFDEILRRHFHIVFCSESKKTIFFFLYCVFACVSFFSKLFC